jgi:hypothetical protein
MPNTSATPRRWPIAVIESSFTVIWQREPVDWSPSLHDQEHGEQDDGAYQDSSKKISRDEQSP